MEFILLGLGLVLVFEGLILALLPKRLEDLIQMISEMPIDTRRTIGLAAIACGTVLVWLSK